MNPTADQLVDNLCTSLNKIWANRPAPVQASQGLTGMPSKGFAGSKPPDQPLNPPTSNMKEEYPMAMGEANGRQ